MRNKLLFLEKWKKRSPTSAKKIWSTSRKFFYSLLGWLANLFLGPLNAADPFSKEKLPLGRVAVLGRAKSCELFVGEAKKQSFSAIILCNFEDLDLASPELCDAIRQVPYVILLTQLGEPALSFRLAKFLGVTAVTIIRREHPPLAEQSVEWNDNPLRRRRVWRLNRLGLPVQPLPKEFSPRLQSEARGAGLCGVAMASVLSDEVEVFGIEFYRTDYISGSYEEVAGEVGQVMHLRPNSHLFQQSFERIVTRQAHVQFRLHSYGDHSIDQDNVTILRGALEG
jgi:hypothetical protein